MILKEWWRGETINEVVISHAQFWVQIHGLPMEHLDENNAYLLGIKLGSVTKVEMVDFNKPYLRVQVLFDIKFPLQPGFYLPREEQNLVWISFKYERLLSFYLIYGRITHTMGTCIDDEHPFQSALGEEMRGMVPIEELAHLLPQRTQIGQGGADGGNIGEQGVAPLLPQRTRIGLGVADGGGNIGEWQRPIRSLSSMGTPNNVKGKETLVLPQQDHKMIALGR